MSEVIERNVIKTMVQEYDEIIANIVADLELYSRFTKTSIEYALSGKIIQEPYSKDRKTYSFDEIMNIDYLKKEIKKTFWQKVFQLTGVRSVMPIQRLNEWNETIESGDLPEFTDENIRGTVFGFFNSTRQYMAEKVDGVLKNLSPNHKTNIHDQITERFIFENVFDKNGYLSYTKAGLIDDLRSLIQQINGNLSYEQRNSSYFINNLYNYNTGVWKYVDGNAFRIRVYKKGTMHVELHPTIVEEMCGLLSEIYPMQIANKDRVLKQKKEFKNFEFKKTLLPREICNVLTQEIKEQYNYLKLDRHYTRNSETEVNKKKIDELLAIHKYNFKFSAKLNPDYQEEFDKLLYFHGIEKIVYNKFVYWYASDYDFRELLLDIGIEGGYDDYKSYQYYPTKENIANKVIEMADFKTGKEKTLEPSAGQGGLVKLIPSINVHCVEISKINSYILKERFSFINFNRTLQVFNEDFLKFSKKTKERYDRIVMNPPFSQGRAKKHVEEAYKLLEKEGVLVAVLPASFKGKEIISGVLHEYSNVYISEFDNTNVNVVILKIKCKN